MGDYTGINSISWLIKARGFRVLFQMLSDGVGLTCVFFHEYETMMKKKSTITAGELLAELQKDPAWVAKQHDNQVRKKQLSEEFARLEETLLSELKRAGLDI